MARVLWVNSYSFETETYREQLSERGYVVDNARNVVEGLPKLDASAYDAIFLNPYFLSWGDINVRVPESVKLEDPLGFGLWFYDKIRESKSNTPLFLVPASKSDSTLRARLESRMKRDSGPVVLCPLLHNLPRELCDIVDRTLRK